MSYTAKENVILYDYSRTSFISFKEKCERNVLTGKTYDPKSLKPLTDSTSLHLRNAKRSANRCSRYANACSAGEAWAIRDGHCRSCGFVKITFALFKFSLGQPLLRVGHYGRKFRSAHTAWIVVTRDADARQAHGARVTRNEMKLVDGGEIWCLRCHQSETWCSLCAAARNGDAY